MSKIDDILASIKAEVKVFEAHRDSLKAERDAKIRDAGLDLMKGNQGAAALRQQIEAEAAGRIKAAEKKLDDRVIDLREQAAVARDEQQAAIVAAHFDDQRAHDPHTATQWAEARAREDFVRADLEALSPVDLVRYYLHADARGDTVGRYLAGRQGRDILRARMDAAEPLSAAHSAALEALHDLEALTVGPADARRQEAEAALAATMAEIQAPLTPADTRQVADKFGVKTYD